MMTKVTDADYPTVTSAPMPVKSGRIRMSGPSNIVHKAITIVNDSHVMEICHNVMSRSGRGEYEVSVFVITEGNYLDFVHSYEV